MKKYITDYLKNRPPFYSFIRPKELELLSRYLPYKNLILDFGCGDGFFAKTLFGNKKIDVGVDINDKIKKEAKESGVYKKLIIYDGKKLPLRDNFFSSVLSNCVLEHVDDLEPTLKDIRRVMKKGGKFYTTVMSDKWEDYLVGARIFGKSYLNLMRRIQKHKNLYSVKDWDSCFRKCGFKIVKRIGYESQKAVLFNEMLHFTSLGSLITYKLFGKWVLFPEIYNYFPTGMISKITEDDLSTLKSACVFYILEK